MQRTVATWDELTQLWDGVVNFMMAGDCTPFSFAMPPIEDVIDVVRHDEEVHVNPGHKGDAIDITEINDAFRNLPLDKAVSSNFRLAHHHIYKFDKPGGMLKGFGEQVIEPFQNALREHGFTWEWFRAYFFISGPGCATNYHIDKSHAIAWQQHGTKIFSSLKDPPRWMPFETRMKVRTDAIRKPAGLTDDDVVAYELKPGSALWAPLLTPHWTEAVGEPACSISFSMRGLRHQGRLCPYEQELCEHDKKHLENVRAKTVPY